MKTVITRKDINKGIKTGVMKSTTMFINLKKYRLVEVVKNHVYELHKADKRGYFRSVIRFNDKSFESAINSMEFYIDMFNK